MFTTQGLKQTKKTNMQGQSNEVLYTNSQPSTSTQNDVPGDSSNNQIDRTNLIINYIPQSAMEAELTSIFGRVGQIDNIRIMRDYRTGCSVGYGFVKYTTPEDAAKAIKAINGLNYRGKRLKVSYSIPLGRDTKDNNLYVTNLPANITEEDIDRIFGEFGEIIQKNILKDKVTGHPRDMAFVRFAKTEQARAAMTALNGKLLENAILPLYIRVAHKRHTLPIT